MPQKFKHSITSLRENATVSTEGTGFEIMTIVLHSVCPDVELI